MSPINPVHFIGREDELENLEQLKRKKVATLVVVKGRRRIGKSRLIDEFAKDTSIYNFVGLAPDKGITAQSQREEFSRKLSQQFNVPPVMANDWGDLLDWLSKLTQQGRQIVLLDEITWMSMDDPTFLPKLKTSWDLYFSKNPQMILILCGSVSAWIEKNILCSTGYFGRVATEITLEELPLGDCNRLLSEVGITGSTLERFMLLSLTGGVPWYIELMNPALSAIENIKALCFRKNGVLVKEYQRIFHDLFGRRSEVYRKIIDSLTEGPKTYTQLSTDIDYPSGGPLSDYLEELVLSGFVSRDYTWNISSGSQIDVSQYRLKDNFLRFYLKCISPNLTRISKDLYRHAPLSQIPGWNTITGLQFENLVLQNRELIWQTLHINPSEIINENPYLQRKTKLQKGCQIDYLIQTKFNVLYLCEIKFTQKKIGASVLTAIQQKIDALNLPKGYAIKPILIYTGAVTKAVQEAEYFAEIIDFERFLTE